MTRVLISVVSAPVLGFIGGFILMIILIWILRKHAPDRIRLVFSRLQWLTTAYQGKEPGKEHLIGLARMYVDDPRFAANYETAPGDGGAIHVRDALIHWAEDNCGE